MYAKHLPVLMMVMLATSLDGSHCPPTSLCLLTKPSVTLVTIWSLEQLEVLSSLSSPVACC